MAGFPSRTLPRETRGEGVRGERRAVDAPSLQPPASSLKEDIVSHYSVEELIARWKKEELTVEQMIGQILQLLRAQEQRLRELARNPAGTQPTTPPQPQRVR